MVYYIDVGGKGNPSKEKRKMKVTYEMENGKKIKVKTYADGTVKEISENGSRIHMKSIEGDELWIEYDSNGNLIHYKDNDGNEWFAKDYEARKAC